MPKVSETKRTPAQALAKFEAGFRRSLCGNIWRRYDGWTVCVFRRRDGSYGWSVSPGDDYDDRPRFSPDSYEIQDEALLALARELCVDVLE